jgi:hypothetical protein
MSLLCTPDAFSRWPAVMREQSAMCIMTTELLCSRPPCRRMYSPFWKHPTYINMGSQWRREFGSYRHCTETNITTFYVNEHGFQRPSKRQCFKMTWFQWCSAKPANSQSVHTSLRHRWHWRCRSTTRTQDGTNFVVLNKWRFMDVHRYGAGQDIRQLTVNHQWSRVLIQVTRRWQIPRRLFWYQLRQRAWLPCDTSFKTSESAVLVDCTFHHRLLVE